MTADSAQQPEILDPGGSGTNHGIHRPEQVARKMLRFVEKTRSCNSRLGHGSNAGHSLGVEGADARRATPPVRGWRAGGSLAVASSTPATPLFSPAQIRELNHA